MQNVHAFGPETPDLPSGAGVLDATATVTAAKTGKIPVAADFSCKEATTIMQVTCTDLSTARGAPIVQWAWQLSSNGGPDMIRTQTVNPWVNYDYPGEYPITLTVTDSTGAVSTLSRPFQVLPPTLIDLSAGAATSFSAKNGDMLNFDLVVPADVKSLTFTLSPATSSESATLDIRAGTPSMLPLTASRS
jgi:serine protease